MEKVSILHLMTTAKNASPFDVNMAFDAGYERVVPYTNVQLEEVMALTQDAIFSRSPKGLKAEALFFGGRDVHVALDMQKEAQSAMFKPFEVSTFSDPSGAFTTGATMLAKVNNFLKDKGETLKGQKITVFGASGAVGSTAALIAAQQGANVQMVAHSTVESMEKYAQKMTKRYGVDFSVVDAIDLERKMAVLKQADIILCAAPAGTRVFETSQLKEATDLKLVIDLNAVPPAGIEGVKSTTNGDMIEGTNIACFGALAIGQDKYHVQHKLLHNMMVSDEPVHIDYLNAYTFACEYL